MIELKPVTLEGSAVRLEPLEARHFDGLCEVGLEPELWRWALTPVQTREEVAQWLKEAVLEAERKAALPFAIIEKASGKAIGSSRFANIDLRHSRVEIGWSWIAPAWQGTLVNAETKYLMLSHAFEALGCMRVEFKADALNERSCAALRRIGAKEEGTLRRHMIVAHGRVRDTVYFSILDVEWPDVKRGLESRLEGKR